MKKMVNALKYAVFTAAAAGVLALSGCASAPSAPPAAPMAQRPKIIDWQGAAYGTEIPEWARIILQGDEVDKIQKMPEFSKMAEQAIGIFSSNKISGFEKSREFWVQQEKAGKTQFEYVVLYSIDKDNFQEQIDRALGKIAAKSAQEKEALSRINDLVKMSALRATSEPEER